MDRYLETTAATQTAPGPLPAVVVEALSHLRSYAAGGYRCRCEAGDVEIVEYVPLRTAALALLDELGLALLDTPGPGTPPRTLRLAG